MTNPDRPDPVCVPRELFGQLLDLAAAAAPVRPRALEVVRAGFSYFLPTAGAWRKAQEEQ